MDLRTRLESELTTALAAPDRVAATALRVAIGALDEAPDREPAEVIGEEIGHLVAAADRLAAGGSPSAQDAERQAAVLSALLA